MSDRAEVLWRAPWPRPDLADVAVMALWLGLIVLAAGALRHGAKLRALLGRVDAGRRSDRLA
jgi:hypothetical protein